MPNATGFRRAAAVSLALLACAACAGGPGPSASIAPPPDPRTQMGALEDRIFALIQEERRVLDPKAKRLALDSELAGVARARSEDMAKKSYMAHAGPDGQTSATLIMDKDQDFQGLLGENIAAEHFTPQLGVDVEVFAHQFVKTWLDSPEHRENLEFGAYDRSGVGAAVNDDTVYVTQLFATDLGLSKHVTNPKARQVVSLAHPKAETPAPALLHGPIVPAPKPRPASSTAAQ